MSAQGINKFTCIGNLTAKPALRYTQSGSAVLSGRVAVDESVPQKGGTWGTRTTFFNFSLFGKRAEGLSKVLDKGQGLYLEGPIQGREWQGQDGKARFSMEINVRELRITRWPQGKQTQAAAAEEVAPPVDDEALAEIEEAPVA